MQAFSGEAALATAVAEVLIVDDSREFTNYMTRLLALESPDLAVALWDFTRGMPPSDFDWSHTRLVLLDYRLGSENGLVWLEALRARPGVPPIVMVTSSRDERVRETALALGARAFFLKEDLTRAALARLLRELGRC